MSYLWPWPLNTHSIQLFISLKYCIKSKNIESTIVRSVYYFIILFLSIILWFLGILITNKNMTMGIRNNRSPRKFSSKFLFLFLIIFDKITHLKIQYEYNWNWKKLTFVIIIYFLG